MRQLNSAELNEVNGALNNNEIVTMIQGKLFELGEYAKPLLEAGCRKGAENLNHLATIIPTTDPFYVGAAIAGTAILAVAYNMISCQTCSRSK